MKSRTLMGLALLMLFAVPASAQKVHVDYDSEFDFQSVKTFAWSSTPDTSLEEKDPLLHSRIVNGIEHHLSMAGFTEVKDNPDMYVTYHTSTEERLSLNTTHYGYGYPGSWHGGYYGRGGVGTSISVGGRIM